MLFAGAYIHRVALCWTVLTFIIIIIIIMLLHYYNIIVIIIVMLLLLLLHSSCDLVMLSVPGGCNVQLPPLDVTGPPSLLKDQV